MLEKEPKIIEEKPLNKTETCPQLGKLKQKTNPAWLTKKKKKNKTNITIY